MGVSISAHRSLLTGNVFKVDIRISIYKVACRARKPCPQTTDGNVFIST